MKKRLASLLLSLVAVAVITPLSAQVTESISTWTTVTEQPKVKKPRKVTDSFWSASLLGGVGLYQSCYTYHWGYPYTQTQSYNSGEATGDISIELAYQQRIQNSNFYWGGRFGGGWVTQEKAGFYINVAPTVSYMRHPGGFYNSFELKFGLGLGYRSRPESGFAVTPQLDAMYWFNYIGVGAYVKYSIAKSTELLNEEYHYVGNQNYELISDWVHVPGWQFGAGMRVAVRF